jgi:hypothetical protein
VGQPDAPPEPQPPLGDVAVVFGQDEHGTHILRRRSEEAPLEAGLLRPLREGKPIDGEVIRLTPRREGPMLFDVKTELPDPRSQRATTEGPAQVANEAYRRGWDAVWGGRRRNTPVLN